MTTNTNTLESPKTATPLYDSKLIYMRAPKHERGHIGVNIRKLFTDNGRDRNLISKVTLPVSLAQRRQRGKMSITPAVWEACDVGAQHPWAILASAQNGGRPSASKVFHIARNEEGVTGTNGRRALVEILPGSLILLANQQYWNETQFLIFRVDDIFPWPGVCPQKRDDRDLYAVANMSLIATRRADRFQSDGVIWTLPELVSQTAPENASSLAEKDVRRATRIMAGIDELVKTAYQNLTQPDLSVPYVEFFSTAIHKDKAVFTIPDDAEFQSTTTTPEGFTSVVQTLFKEYRTALRGSLGVDERMPRSLPCSVAFSAEETDGVTSVLMTLEVPSTIPDEFKPFSVTTTLTQELLPDTLAAEGALVYRSQTLTDLLKHIAEHGELRELFTLL